MMVVGLTEEPDCILSLRNLLTESETKLSEKR